MNQAPTRVKDVQKTPNFIHYKPIVISLKVWA